ncbi:metal-dependent protein hydrolase [Lineolata rhizophorae]|uniref:Metal-dependent protein hydrolase n=1 Tax=Lineolata rhizophorae TaxID=578093 RepID=A0A6A6PC49_9PEZI|nr:metal-dependent protein hydrolase [Lineolata rhizophorae]
MNYEYEIPLAVYLLRLLPEYRDAPLLRTRDPAGLATCHTVVDVGGEYEPSRRRFDHHQRGFDAVFPGSRTKLSSAGLVYLHYGRRVISSVTGLTDARAGQADWDPRTADLADKEADPLALLWFKLYEDLVEAFDANDNGIPVFDPAELARAGVERRFEDRGFTIASVVNRFNFDYGERKDGVELAPEQAQAAEDARFARASEFVGLQFLGTHVDTHAPGLYPAELRDKHLSWLPARAIVSEAFAARDAHSPSGRILVLPHRDAGIPWADHLYELERATRTPPDRQVLYVLFPEGAAPDAKWRVRAVGVEGQSFVNRKDLPDAWKGVREEGLSKVSGIDGCVFVHASGFIGGNKTFEGALKMAHVAVDM